MHTLALRITHAASHKWAIFRNVAAFLGEFFPSILWHLSTEKKFEKFTVPRLPDQVRFPVNQYVYCVMAWLSCRATAADLWCARKMDSGIRDGRHSVTLSYLMTTVYEVAALINNSPI